MNGPEQGKIAFIALGGNLANPKSKILEAADRLEKFSDQPLLRSSLWQTSPVDCPPSSPVFVNAVIGLVPRSTETPESLLGKLQELERQFGRSPKKTVNEPRPLDLDLIAFGDQTRSNEILVLPHPRAHLRRFVLQPLSEIAPQWRLPGQARTVNELLAELPLDPNMCRI